MDPGPDPKNQELQDENLRLRKTIQEYKRLDEDLAAQRIYEKAKKQITAWMTVGGIAAVVAGVLTFNQLSNYAKGLAADAVKTAAGSHVEDLVAKEVEHQVGMLIQKEQPDIEVLVRQQVAISTQPIGRSVRATLFPAPNAASIDYTASMLPVREQGNEGSATGFAVAFALEYQIRKIQHEAVRISPRFIYNATREQENTLSQDSGAILGDAVRLVLEQGAVLESTWPYNAGDFREHEPERLNDAKRYRISSVQRLNNLGEVKAALASVGPVVAGFTVYSSFLATKSGVVPIPAPNETLIGGYPVCVVGYDDQKKLLKFESSWGATWGDHGFGYLPYDYVNKYMGTDNWALMP